MDEQETFISHLIELRDRLLRAIIAWVVVFVALFPWARDLYTLLAKPLLAKLPQGGQMIATEVVTPFFVPVKVAMLTGFLVALPYILYQLWAFVAPGLYTHEKRLVLPLVVSSTVLFIAGMAFAYFLVMPVVFGFITSIAPEGVAVMTDISKYLDFVMTLFIAFGITFEVPIAVIVLVRFGVVSIEKLKEARPYVIVGAFVIAAIVTPPDVISQIMLAVPLCLLYEAGIFLARFVVRRTADDYRPMTDEEMERELDRIERGEN
ncbi:MAG: twin-arginine translocase subunit TatC [Azospira oryzae]|uniref:Sec-independent protein translocase protein TatC n=1 Tax=Pelomicrobium methylotrophicum TaxID=2602750 RepID=A0A5C7EU28_9PROT|nr:twin-arginine translocase subunit TatC [Pelomicrobium methylotrophicum]PZP64876.1 MAG: twin-arginine translocase subunit TatC [Azospira oryzae]PZP82840.1 MAG: twin-arginine translocase subunit TatC [Azospira oryzae]TXF10550.1 twin-arginine translocase subunit TatC [Pelomicrobium methylotrophicum]